jgi:riboflavin kinase/FMN adenylyltransferase
VHTWRDVNEVPPDWPGSVAVIGVFDGVHQGHRAVLGRARERAVERRLPLVVVTFDPHPMRVVRPNAAPYLLVTLDERVRLLGAAGADAVLVLPFTREFSQLSSEEFVEQVLVKGIHVQCVVVGADFRFGHRAAGDVARLRTLGDRFGFAVDAVDLVGADRDRVSSSGLRDLLSTGDVAAVASLLGRSYTLDGEVVMGDQRGRALGYPTANMLCPPGLVLPAEGVYAGWLIVAESTRLPAAISVGANPTFDGTACRVEAYALDRDDLELYGKRVTVEFSARLRGMQRFDSPEALRKQMVDDVARCRELLGRGSVHDRGRSST